MYIEPSLGLSGNVMLKISNKEFWHQFKIKMVTVIYFLFYVFLLHTAIHKNATHVYNEKSPVLLIDILYCNDRAFFQPEHTGAELRYLILW
jgi:hypothetical protein